jgi:hypothetical protein
MTEHSDDSAPIEEKPKPHRQTARQDLIDVLAKKLAKKLVKQLTSKAEKPIQDFRANLPKDAYAIRQLPFYATTLNTLKWQRDNYLVGESYANRNQETTSLFYYSRMPLDATCLGHLQIVHLGSWFVPSATIKESLLPIVVALPLGSLYEPIVGTVANAIPLAQPLLDAAVKHSLIDFMQNPMWRHVIKTQTKGYIGNPNQNGESNEREKKNSKED